MKSPEKHSGDNGRESRVAVHAPSMKSPEKYSGDAGLGVDGDAGLAEPSMKSPEKYSGDLAVAMA